MASITEDISKIADDLDAIVQTKNKNELDVVIGNIIKATELLDKSWSHSWLGYHSRVYYEGFQIPPAGAIFSSEWGFEELYSIPGTTGAWEIFEYDAVIDHLLKKCGNPDLDMITKMAREAMTQFEDLKSKTLSLISLVLKSEKDDFINEQKSKVENIICYTKEDLIKAQMPRGQLMSRDARAATAGIQSPPHIAIQAFATAALSPFHAAEKLARNLRIVASHIIKVEGIPKIDKQKGTKVFIGHGKSKQWKELKDFIQDRMLLPWDEFNRVPIAGITNITRLSEMLDNAVIAFLVLTAEDEQLDGKINPRMNVIHEAGLFQGRLGFEKAIILLEDGCQEFSNINGLGQIRYPTGRIETIFENIRLVLEREGLIS